MLFGQQAGFFVGHDVEADDDGVGSVGQVHVGLADAADRGLQHFDFDFGMIELAEFFQDGFDRAAHVGAQNDVERLHFGGAQAIEQVFQGDVDRTAGAERGQAGLIVQLAADFAGVADIFQHVELVAGGRGLIEAGDVDRHRGAGFVEFLRGLERIVDGFDVAAGDAADDGIADAQRAALHEQFGHDAAAFVQFGLEAGADGATVGIGL